MKHQRAGWAIALGLLVLPMLAHADDKPKQPQPPAITKDYDEVRDITTISTKDYDIPDIGFFDAFYTYDGKKPTRPDSVAFLFDRVGDSLEMADPEDVKLVYFRYGDVKSTFPVTGHSAIVIGVHIQEYLTIQIPTETFSAMCKASKVLLEIKEEPSSIKGESLAAMRELLKEMPPPDPPKG
ncbi:MAG: hypothetical protein M3Y56_07950 [Armatimonadota bacterium]|nr:hypothetical protein [Armatimonadota bacterium]